MKTECSNGVKKTAILALTLVLGVSCLTACGNTKQPESSRPKTNQTMNVNGIQVPKPSSVAGK